MIRFHGKERSAVPTRTDFGGRSLILSTRAVLGHVSGYMLTNVDLSHGERREEHLFDFESFREAWINACVHNAWHTLVPPAVMIFDDRIEVVSYERIPFPLSTEDFFAGDSRPINTSLFQLFLRTGLTEHSGHGVPTIVRHYGREAFHISDNGVTVRSSPLTPARISGISSRGEADGCRREARDVIFLGQEGRGPAQVGGASEERWDQQEQQMDRALIRISIRTLNRVSQRNGSRMVPN